MVTLKNLKRSGALTNQRWVNIGFTLMMLPYLLYLAAHAGAQPATAAPAPIALGTRNFPVDLPLKNEARPRPYDTLYLDSMPSWADDDPRLLFWSRRNLSQVAVTTQPPLNKKPPPPRTGMETITQSLSMIRRDGSAQAIISLPPDSTSGQAIAWNSVKRRIAFELKAEIKVFDFATGSLGKASQAGRVLRGSPAWSLDGQYLAMAGSHSPSDQRDKNYRYGQDIFVSRIADEIGPASNVENWCVAQFPGTEILPIFTPDGQSIIFAHLEPPQRGQKAVPWQESQWALYRVEAFGKAPKNEPPVKIVGNLPYPTRLSWYPDGTRLLVSYAAVQGVGYGDAKYGLSHQPEVINVRDGTRKTLNLLPLYAPGMEGGVPLVPENIVINSSGRRLAFNAFTWSGDPKDTAVAAIYSCDLNGANIRQHSLAGEMEMGWAEDKLK